MAKYTVKTFHPLRRATIGGLEAASRKHMIHALVEVDVAEARALVRRYKEVNGESLSFTAYLIHCLSRAVAMNRHMHAFRDWRNRLIALPLFLNTLVFRIMDRFPHLILCAV